MQKFLGIAFQRRFVLLLPWYIAAMLFSVQVAAQTSDFFEWNDLRKSGDSRDTVHKKDKTLVLQLWASWCQNCSTITPMVASEVRSLESSQLEFLTVSVDDDRADALGYVKKHTSLFDGLNLQRFHDPAGASFKKFGVVGIPATLVLHKSGKTSIFYGYPDLKLLRSALD